VRDEAVREYGYNLQRDGWLNAFTEDESQTMRDDGVPWRGAREKHHLFFKILFATLTDKNDIIMDWQCGVGMCFLSSSTFLSTFHFIFHILYSILTFLGPSPLGGSILACRSLDRHIVALESDPDIFNALLLPMRDPQPQRTSRQVAPPTTSIFDPPQKLTKRAFGFLCA